MTKIKPGLGRGLDALINPNFKEGADTSVVIANKNIQKDDGTSYDVLAQIPVNMISPNPYQPRLEFDSSALDDLKKSILENGLIQPVTVRRTKDERYELISGERRLRACKDIGFKEIPAYIIKVETKEGMVALSLIENIQREQLNPIEVAIAYRRLIEECNLSQEEVAEKIGKDRSTITNSIRLLKLPQPIQDSLIKGEISAGHARALINLPTEYLQLSLLGKIIKNNLSVRNVEEAVKKLISSNKNKSSKQSKPEHNNLASLSKGDLENKLRGILGTKVLCNHKKDGSGQIVIEYYSQEELERLFELFEIIGKNYN